MQDIIIKKIKYGWDVIVGDAYTGQLTYEEVLGVVASLVIQPSRRCLSWLKTKKEWDNYDKRVKRKIKRGKRRRICTKR
jgi:hypothetical protein